MIVARLITATVLALAAGLAGSAAVSSQRAFAPLIPLSEHDQTSTQETGCTCAFVARRNTLAQMIGHEFMVRTRSGRRACRITDAQFSDFSDAHGSIACSGLRLSVKRTGRVRQHPEADSAEGPADLTVSQGRSRRVIAGNWGCAC